MYTSGQQKKISDLQELEIYVVVNTLCGCRELNLHPLKEQLTLNH